MSYNEPPNYGTPPPPPGGSDGGYGGGYGGGYDGGGGYGGGYGAPQQPGFNAPPEKSVLAIIGLVLGIIGLIPCLWGCFVFSIAALVLGFLGQNEVKQGKKTGKGLAVGAIWTGVAGILFSILAVVLIVTDVIDIYSY